MKIDHLRVPVFLVSAGILVSMAMEVERYHALLVAMIAICALTLFFIAMIRCFPELKSLAIETIAVVFIPSYVAHTNWLQFGALDRTRELFDASGALGAFITVLVFGSVLSIDAKTLFVVLARLVIPLLIGSLAAAAVGVCVAYFFGIEPFDALLLLVVPIMGGGLTAGLIPLSIGYAGTVGSEPEALVAAMIPAVIVGNLAAMGCAGILDYWDRRGRDRPSDHIPGERQLVVHGEPASALHVDTETMFPTVAGLGTAAVFLTLLYCAGAVASAASGVAVPLMVIFFAVLLQVSDVIPLRYRQAVVCLYGIVVKLFTYPMLFAVGFLLTPWAMLVRGFAPANLAAISASVVTLAVSGALLSRWAGLDAVNGGIVTLTRAAMGGTGDVAILSAARRMDLMPFAQIATRVGGAITVALALFALDVLSR